MCLLCFCPLSRKGTHANFRLSPHSSPPAGRQLRRIGLLKSDDALCTCLYEKLFTLLGFWFLNYYWKRLIYWRDFYSHGKWLLGLHLKQLQSLRSLLQIYCLCFGPRNQAENYLEEYRKCSRFMHYAH